MWEQIQANRRRSIFLMVGMGLVLAALGGVAGEGLLGPGAWWMGLAVAAVIWSGQMMAYFSASESLLLHGIPAREIGKEDCPRLFNIVEEMQIASGLPATPRILLIDDPAPNAFAMGRRPEKGAIAVTTGLLQRLNRDELQGVIAHEMSHLRNRDSQFMMLAVVMLGSIVMLSEIVTRSMRLGRAGRARSLARGGGQAQVVILVMALLLAILGPLMAQLFYFACSRKREFLADACGAQFTRYPEGLAAALERISASPIQVSFVNKVTAPMFIVSPLCAAGADGFFSTHPPTMERTGILRAMGGASLADYEAAYRQGRGGGLIGARSLGEATTQAIRAASDEGPIESRQNVRDLSRQTYGYLPITCSCGLQTRVPFGADPSHLFCVRCGQPLTVMEAAPPPEAAPEPSAEGERAPPLAYQRTGAGWEAFRCGCGHVMQLSPGFLGDHVNCTKCGRHIEIKQPGAALSS